MASLLRQYVDGNAEGATGRSVVRGMKARKASRAAAARVLGRVDSAQRSLSREAFGSASTRSKPGKKKMGKLAAASSELASTSVMELLPAIVLPPEGVSNPTSFKLEKTGLVTITTEDADGTDELTTFAIIATPDEQDFTLSTIELGTGQQSSPGMDATTQRLHTAGLEPALVITAVIEDDGGNAAAAREELEVLVALAASVAATTAGTDRLAVLKSMVDYTVAIDGIGSDASRAARSVVATPFASADWFPLWSTDTETTGAASWKLAIPHQMGTGRYELLLDVPSTMPSMKTVRVRMKQFELHEGPPQGWTVTRKSVRVSIGDKSHQFQFDGAPSSFKSVERKVIDGEVKVGASGWIQFSPPPVPVSQQEKHLRACLEDPEQSRKNRTRCRNLLHRLLAKSRRNRERPVNQEIDFAGGSAAKFFATYSTVTGGFKRANNPKGGAPSSSAPTTPVRPLRETTTKGSDSTWAKLTLEGFNR